MDSSRIENREGRSHGSKRAVPLIRAFAALRAVPEHAAELAAPPYDVLTIEEARMRARGKPWSFLHVSRAEIDLPAKTDPYDSEVYAKAAENFRRMVEAGMLRRDPTPAYYVYRLSAGEHVQTGLAVAASIEAYLGDRIRRHEVTRRDKEDDRTRHIEALGAQTGPVLLTHRPCPEAARILKRVAEEPPSYAFSAEGGVGHALWMVAQAGQIDRLTRAFGEIEALDIADGHHRSAAAARIAERGRANNPRHRGDEPYNYFLAVAFPADEMRIFAYDRLVRDLRGSNGKGLLERVRERFDVEPSPAPLRPARPHEFGMYLGGAWYRLALREAPSPQARPRERLDVSLLSVRLLEPVLGIGDPRRDPRIDFVGGARGLEALERRVDSGEMAVAFTLYPTRMEDLMAVADAGETMPPKSTWFEPKLADGLVSYLLG